LRRGLAIVAIVAACTSVPVIDRRAERAACELISPSGNELATCLVMKYDWPAESVGPAKFAWQWHLDSLRRDHEAQANAVLAEQRRRADSIEVAQTRAFRVCLQRFIEAYHRSTADTARARGNESYLGASVRTCLSRFPAADYMSTATGAFIDSLILIPVAQPTR